MSEINIDHAQKPFFLSHTFDASREQVWKAWTECERVKEWFGPKGFTTTVANMDFRPGGTYHYCMRSPEGHEMWGKFVYREIVEPELIVLVNSFSDAAGNFTRHPMVATWPLEILSKFTLAEEGDRRTTVTVEGIPANATEEERKTFDASHEGMKMGWTGTFNQLGEYLAKA